MTAMAGRDVRNQSRGEALHLSNGRIASLAGVMVTAASGSVSSVTAQVAVAPSPTDTCSAETTLVIVTYADDIDSDL